MAQRRLAKERQALAEREAAAEAQMQEARHTMAAARGIKQAAMEQVARCEQEAAAQVEAAEFRLTRSVETNIGRQTLIQKLRKQVNELKEQARAVTIIGVESATGAVAVGGWG